MMSILFVYLEELLFMIQLLNICQLHGYRKWTFQSKYTLMIFQNFFSSITIANGTCLECFPQVGFSGHGKNGSLCVLQQSIHPELIKEVCIYISPAIRAQTQNIALRCYFNNYRNFSCFMPLYYFSLINLIMRPLSLILGYLLIHDYYRLEIGRHRKKTI